MSDNIWTVEVDLTEPITATMRIHISEKDAPTEKEALKEVRKQLKATGYDWKPNRANTNWRIN